MKPTQNNNEGGRRESGSSQNNPQNYSSIQDIEDIPSHTPRILANYTLPGVISYLTSEFTSLERFKIMTDLEKSEMKYQIQQLTSELQSVRFINEKQALRIKILEEKLEKSTTSDLPLAESVRVVVERNSASCSLSNEPVLKNLETLSLRPVDPEQGFSTKNPKSNCEGVDLIAGSYADQTVSSGIPHVDLNFLRNSRSALNKSIREIVKLLEPPSRLYFSDTHSGVATCTNIAELLDDSRHFSCDTPLDPPENPKESMFVRYTLSKDNITSQRTSLKDSGKQLGESVGLGTRNKGDQILEQSSWNSLNHEHALTDESDTETVTFDEPEFESILAHGSV